MDVQVETVQAQVPVTIMRLQGELDASTYLDVIEKAREVVRSGATDLLFDLSDLSFISSSGLVTLHSVAMLMRGEAPLDPEAGWGTLGAIANEVDSGRGYEEHFKLLHPQPQVQKALVVTGFDQILEVFQNREAALAAF